MSNLKLDITADSRYSFDRKGIRKSLENTLAEQGVEERVRVSLSIVGERKMKELEKKYFGRDEVTDVLSFPLREGESAPEDEDGVSLGDIVICFPQAKRQALQWNRLLDEEIEFLAAHGLLHLLGVHHE